MKECKGDFIFKSIEKRDGGTFTNENGKEIEYDASYRLKVDEITENGIDERIFKIPLKSRQLYEDLKALKHYDAIVLEFDIVFSNSVGTVKLIPIDFELGNM